MRNFHRFIAAIITLAACAWSPSASGLSVVQNFELSDGGYVSTGLNTWAWGQPSATSSAGGAHSGTQAWGTNLIGVYGVNLNAALVSPSYDLSAAAGQHVVLHWWQHLITEEGFDFADVQVSKDGGGSWETVRSPRSGVVTSQWTEQTVLLDSTYATAGFRVRFRLTTDSSTSVGGFFVDDIRISTMAFTQAASTETFEAGNGGYVKSGTNASWEYGTPVTAPSSAKSGASVWATNLNGFYQEDEDSALTSPVLDLSGAAGGMLAVTWAQFLDTEEEHDFLNLEVSADGGTSWTVVSTQSGAVSALGWTRAQAFVPASFATADFRLRFHFMSDDSFQYNGVALDDIAILRSSTVFPVAGSFSKSAPENFPIRFAVADFVSAFSDPDGGTLKEVQITQLPAAGSLILGTVPVALNDVIPISGLADLKYVPAADTTGSWTCQYVVSNFFAASSPGTITLNILGPTPTVVITDHPVSAVVNPDSTVQFSVVAVSSLQLSYQWRLDGSNINGANGSSYTIDPVEETHEGTYDVVVSNTLNSATSDPAELSVNDPVVITSESGATTVNEGGDTSLEVIATGTGRLDYQWFKDDQPIVGEITASLSIEDATEADTGTYRCEVTNVVGMVSTSPIPLTVRLAPRILSNPVSVGIRAFRAATFSVQVGGTGPFTYQWYKDGFLIPGAIESSLVISDLRDTNIGSYSVKVSNSWATVESEPAQLQVTLWRNVHGIYQDVLENQAPVAGQSPFPGKVNITLSRMNNFSGALSYEGRVYRFAGRFTPQLIVDKIFARRGKSPLKFRFSLDALARTMDVSVSHDEVSGTVLSTAILRRHEYHATTNPAPQKARYTVLLTPAGSVVGAPEASGFLTGTVSSSGAGLFVGRLPNGLAVTMAGLVQVTGRIPFYQVRRHYTGAGAGQVGGRLSFDLSGTRPVMGGGLAWQHIPQTGSAFLSSPFLVTLDAEGSAYVAPKGNQAVVSLPLNATMFSLSIRGPTPGNTLDRWLRLTPLNLFLIDPSTEAKVRFTLNLSNGRISGSFIDLDTGVRRTMEGVVIQAQQTMGGCFRAGFSMGSFLAQPRLQ